MLNVLFAKNLCTYMPHYINFKYIDTHNSIKLLWKYRLSLFSKIKIIITLNLWLNNARWSSFLLQK